MDSSPSIPSRPKQRNSETGDLMRRSFRASPFPGKTTRADSGDKENNKDQISDTVKALPKSAKNFMSPTISAASKINPSPRKKILSDKNELLSRSFDKTVHHHHQPQVRSSVTFSDVVSFIGEEDKDQIFIGEKKKLDEEESHDDVTVTDVDDYSSFDVSPLPTSVPYTFPVFESREVDPSVTPYDPKKNYLSPRPQFLHYRPNPRIECKQQLDELFSSGSSSTDDTDSSAEERRHEEEEEVVSQESVGEEEAVESQQVEKVASEEEAEERQHVEEVTCQEGVVSVAVEEEEAEAIQGENDEEHLEAVESEEEAEETHQVTKRSRFKTSKLLGWVLVLGVAYALLVPSVTVTLPKNIKEGSDFYSKFHIPPEITKSARESFEQLSEKLGMWAGSSLVYVDKLISSLLREEEEEGYGPFQFHNLTGVLEETSLSDAVFQPASGKISAAGSLVDSQDWSLEMDTKSQQEPEELESSGEIDLEAVYEESANGFEQESEGGGEANSEMVYKFDKQTEITVAIATEVNVGDSEEEEIGGQETDDVEEQREFEENDQKNLEGSHEYETRSGQNEEKMMEDSESNAHHLDAEESAAISEHQQEEGGIGESAETEPEEGGTEETAETGLDTSAETSDGEGNDLKEESGIGEEVSVKAQDWKEVLLSNQKKVMVLASTVMVMLAAAAAAAFLLANKKAKPAMHEENEPTTTVPDAKEVNSEHAPVEDLIKERLSTLNFQEEEVNDDRKREEVSSFPSEMSFSFHKDKSLRSCSNRDELKEYQSGGRKSNDSGESMASSASEYSIGGGSVSYGSFTTYEKIQKRSGRKEEEVMVTPVRRSSRIRNHQHSGQ
ncbi:Uncharacterized protein Rs2_01518 [Raphanus sativus]|uniref:Uncharacterized protein LOC108843453 n=1 Tax=Raphanus sativus TaxID=3726 RepID=A0A6J0ML31_RAPSA|nr:uncharacterized protein LOC108843453 [Raphanus sativus]KAJ4915968.1 Uncharacterized protein Rs2_01518 [Raphanus sativus]